MKKIRLTEELIKRASSVFMGGKKIRTGEGLSRAELRCLERKGIVGSKAFQGRKIWFLDTASIDGMIAKVKQ